jgi:hypothetical protein
MSKLADYLSAIAANFIITLLSSQFFHGVRRPAAAQPSFAVQ